MKKIISAVLACVLIVLAAACAVGEKVYYDEVKLPKLTKAKEPNVVVATSGAKQTKNKMLRHRMDSCVDASDNPISATQAVRLWRQDGQSVTRVLWHHSNNSYDMGKGSSTLIKDKQYKLKARGNTDNGCTVYISGWIDPDGGENK